MDEMKEAKMRVKEAKAGGDPEEVADAQARLKMLENAASGSRKKAVKKADSGKAEKE